MGWRSHTLGEQARFPSGDSNGVLKMSDSSVLKDNLKGPPSQANEEVHSIVNELLHDMPLAVDIPCHAADEQIQPNHLDRGRPFMHETLARQPVI